MLELKKILETEVKQVYFTYIKLFLSENVQPFKSFYNACIIPQIKFNMSKNKAIDIVS